MMIDDEDDDEVDEDDPDENDVDESMGSMKNRMNSALLGKPKKKT